MAESEQNQSSFPYSVESNGEQTVDAEFSTIESDTQPRVEEWSINGDVLVNKLQTLIQQGNVRRILVKTQDGKKLFELPLTVGIVGGTIGTILFPFMAAIAVVSVLAIKLNIVIERTE